ncbi:MAG: S-layer protein, partial [Cyanobacteria bacterium PR.023]|nr:S-layer protein [Cyanobacteria bacterium PR.023]
ATPVTKTFSDLGDCPNKELVDDLARLHVFDDLGADFKPYQPITRAEYVTWLCKAYNAIQPGQRQLHLAPQAGPQFKDVSPSHPAYKYIQALAFTGYSIGYLDGTFRPDKPLTREEMIGIKVALDSGKDLPPYRSQMECVWKFSDSKQVDERFTGYVHQDFYISGPKGNNIQRAFGKIAAFHPKQAVLRNEAAATLWQEGQFGFNGPITAGSVTNI